MADYFYMKTSKFTNLINKIVVEFRRLVSLVRKRIGVGHTLTAMGQETYHKYGSEMLE